MYYINAMASAYDNKQDYIFMWRGIIINKMFHNLSDISRDEYVWEPTPAPEKLFRGHCDGVMVGDGGFNHSDREELEHVLLLCSIAVTILQQR